MATITTVANMAALRGTTGTASQVIYLIGWTNDRDGGEGQFVWDATSTVADDGGTVIQVTGVPTGRWKRNIEANPINVLWFGADNSGSTICTGQLQAAINAAANLGGAMVLFPPGTYWVDAALTNTINGRVCIQGAGHSNTSVTGSFNGFIFDSSHTTWVTDHGPCFGTIDGLSITNNKTSIGCDDSLGCIRVNAQSFGRFSNLHLQGWNGVVCEYRAATAFAPFWCHFDTIIFYTISNANWQGGSGHVKGGTCGFIGGMQCSFNNVRCHGGWCGFLLSGSSITLT